MLTFTLFFISAGKHVRKRVQAPDLISATAFASSHYGMQADGLLRYKIIKPREKREKRPTIYSRMRKFSISMLAAMDEDYDLHDLQMARL